MFVFIANANRFIENRIKASWVKAIFENMKLRDVEIVRSRAKNSSPSPLNWDGTKIVDHLTPEDWQGFNAELEELVAQKNDRGVAILSHSFLDDRLRWLLEIKMISTLSKGQKKYLFSNSGPLSSYKARYELAFALGLLNDNFRSELEVFGQIRNKFAHGFKRRSFDDAPISELCDRLGKFDPEALPVPGLGRRERYVGHCFIATSVLFVAGQMLIAGRDPTTVTTEAKSVM
jgi:DNA-binding MltR family transcriptional regulator